MQQPDPAVPGGRRAALRDRLRDLQRRHLGAVPQGRALGQLCAATGGHQGQSVSLGGQIRPPSLTRPPLSPTAPPGQGAGGLHQAGPGLCPGPGWTRHHHQGAGRGEHLRGKQAPDNQPNVPGLGFTSPGLWGIWLKAQGRHSEGPRWYQKAKLQGLLC